MLRILLLGGARIEREGVPARGRATQKRRLAILALLAVAPARTLSRDRIVGLLWPDAEPDAARKVLSEALYVMRRELGDNLLITAGDTVTLGEVTTDVGDFLASIELGSAEGDRAAIDAWQGPFLDGWYLDDAPDFERWAEDQRSRLARTYADAVERVIRAVEADASANGAGPSAELPALWQRLVDLDPLRSRYALGLATARAAAGERAAALQALSAHGDRVRAELEVEPDAQIVALEAQLRAAAIVGSGARRSDPAVAPQSAEPLGVTAPTLPADDSAVSPAPVISAPLPRRRGLAVALGVIGLVIAMITMWPHTSPSTPALDPRRLAVLYFNDGSLERDLGPVADNITEAVVSQLSGVNGLTVISTNGVKPLRGRAVPVDSVAALLKVGTVIEGTVQRRDEQLAVTVRLIDANTGAYQATLSFERSRADLLALERDIARDAAAVIRTRLGRDIRLQELAQGTSNVRAMQLLARGNRDYDDGRTLTTRLGGGDREGAELAFRRADSLFAQAAAEDPRWHTPWLQRGWTALARARLDTGAQRTARLLTAEAMADTVLQRSKQMPEALELRGVTRFALIVHLRSTAADSTRKRLAYQDVEAAVALDSTRARAWATLNHWYMIDHNAPRAYLAGMRALAADTYLEDAPHILQMLLFASLQRNDLPAAERWCSEGHERFPVDWQFVECALIIMQYDQRPRPDARRAWQLVARLDSLDPPALAASTPHAYSPYFRRLVAAVISARAGDTARARAELSRALIAAARDTVLRMDVMNQEILLRHALGERAAAESLLATVMRVRPLDRGLYRDDPLFRAVLSPSGSSRQ